MVTYKDYLERGFATVFPLPAGKKFAPPSEVTGNAKPPSKAKIEALWREAPANANIGLRMPSNVIALDVDNGGTKHGLTEIRKLESQLGPLHLEQLVRCSRREATNLAGHYLFRVEPGKKWEGLACSHVDILQDTHRYSVTEPSTYQGDTYRWLRGTEPVEPPYVKDLPELPEAWQKYLVKGGAKYVKMDNKPAANENGYAEALAWFQRYFLEEYDYPVLSEELDVLTDPPSIYGELLEDSHHTMTSLVFQVVQLGFDGHIGALSALERIKNEFVAAVTGPGKVEGRRTERQAYGEFYRSVIDLVPKCRAEIEAGTLVPEFTIDLDSDGAVIILSKEEREAIGKRERAKKLDDSDKEAIGPKGVQYSLYSDTDEGHAFMFADYWKKDFLVTDSSRGDSEFAIWNRETRRYELRNRTKAAGKIKRAVPDRLAYEADKLLEQVAEMEARISNGEQLGPDEDPDSLNDFALALKARADRQRNAPQQRRIMEQMHAIVENGYSSISVNLADFDSRDMILGLPNGRTIDLDTLEQRDSTREDLLTKGTRAIYQEGFTHPAWENFLDQFVPDPEIREFTQRAMGYSLHPENSEKKIFFLLGPSNTGKSVMLEACIKALGTYGGAPNAKIIFGHQTAGPSPEIISSAKKRMIIFSELGDTVELSSDSIKRMTGVDKMEARHLYTSSMETFTPAFKPYVSTNTAPEIPNIDKATQQRLVVIPFNEARPPEGPVPLSEDVVNNPEVWPAVLNWLVEGYRKYRKKGLTRRTWPVAVVEATHRLTADSSTFMTWVSMNMTETADRTEFVEYTAIRTAWNNTRVADGERPETATMFTKRLKREGLEPSYMMFDGVRRKVLPGWKMM